MRKNTQSVLPVDPQWPQRVRLAQAVSNQTSPASTCKSSPASFLSLKVRTRQPRVRTPIPCHFTSLHLSPTASTLLSNSMGKLTVSGLIFPSLSILSNYVNTTYVANSPKRKPQSQVSPWCFRHKWTDDYLIQPLGCLTHIPNKTGVIPS